MSTENHISQKESCVKSDLNIQILKSEPKTLKSPEEVALEAHRMTAWAKR